jgi:hypothetical protein
VPASNQLTSLANAKAWAGVTTSNDDALLTRLIASASRFILSYIERPSLFKNQYADVFDGVGQRSQMLRNWPVISVQSLVLGNQLIPASPGYPQCGYVLDAPSAFPPGSPQRINLYGHRFPFNAPASVNVIYTAGFVVQNEPWTVPSTGPYAVTVNAPNGSWAVDAGVTYADGTSLAPINGTPSVGQYSSSQGTGAYVFAAADAGRPVLISYSYIPADIENACIELVGDRYSYKGRIGLVSKSLGGQETMSYSQNNMSDYIKSALQPYKSYIPV